MQVFRLKKQIENLETDLAYSNEKISDYERKFGLYQIEKKELVERLTAAEDEIEYLRDKYVNLVRVNVETQFNFNEEPGNTKNRVA